MRLGEISGPGGLGVQVGSGRLSPLDTPPALTLTVGVGGVDGDKVEVLVDWQQPSLSQLQVQLKGEHFLCKF